MQSWIPTPSVHSRDEEDTTAPILFPISDPKGEREREREEENSTSAHPSVRREAVPFFVDLAIAVETDPNELQRRLLDAVLRADEHGAVVAAVGARDIIVALKRRVVNDVGRQHVQLHTTKRSSPS
jgi:hypothetical protein